MIEGLKRKSFIYKTYTLKNFIILSDYEKRLVLNWRNDENIRKWMVQKNIITYDEHLRYIDSLKDKKDKLCFIVKDGDSYLGIVEFDEINKNNGYFGLNINPDLTGHRIGSILMEILIYIAIKKLNIKKLLLSVYTINIKAIDLYQKYGFIIIKENFIENNKIFIMEKKL